MRYSLACFCRAVLVALVAGVASTPAPLRARVAAVAARPRPPPVNKS